MENIKKISIWLIKAAGTCLILLFVVVIIAGITISIKSLHEGVKVKQAVQLIKEKIQLAPEISLGGCVYPKINITIVSINGEAFFGIKDKEVFIPKINGFYENNAKKLAPNVLIKEIPLDIYYLMEHCR
jgi:hypothetical protein